MRVGEGIIEEILEDGLAKVRVNKDSVYVVCGSCFGAERVVITAHNKIGAQKGENIQYHVEDSHLIYGSFLCFILPLLFIAVGAGSGYGIGIELGYNMVLCAIGGAIIGILVSMGFWKLVDRNISAMVDSRPCICKILESEENDEMEEDI